MPKEETTPFVRINVKSDNKREIDIIAAAEQRPVYEVVDEMVRIYMTTKTGKKNRVSVSEMVNYTATKKSRLPRPDKTAKIVPLLEVSPIAE